jgi:iron complex outermembrane receptor protein
MLNKKSRKYKDFTNNSHLSGGFLTLVSYTPSKAALLLSKKPGQWTRGVLCFIFLCLFSATSVGSEQITYQFNIPVQPLVISLNALSSQTQTLVLFPYELVEKRKGNAIHGQFTLAQAIDELLRNTGLIGGLSKKEVMMISQQQLSLPTDKNNGKNTMNSKKSLLATAMAFLFSGSVISTTVNAQETDTTVQQEEVEKIAILGTRGTPRTVTDSPVALDVFSGEEFTSLGNAADITDNLKALVPSFTATPATGDGSAFIRPTSLRGMAPDQTLILVNGKRRHRSALVQFFAPAAGNGAHGVDIGMIPSIALKSVEVLRDGAAAQYGSDAIAGVMNFQLKDANEGGSIMAQYGEFYEGESSWILAANAGFALGVNGFFNISIETNDNEALSRGVQSPEAQVLIDAGVVGVGADSPFGDEPFVQSWGRPETSGTRMAFNSGYEVGELGELYAHGGYADTDGRYRFFYRNPSHSTLANVTTLPAGYTPYLDGAQKDYSFVAGLKGETGSELTYNLSVGVGKSKLDYFLWNTINSGLVDSVAGTPGQRDFDMGGYEQDELNFNADFGMPLTDNVYLGLGAEWREETFTTIAGEQNAYGVSPGPSGMSSVTPADAGEFSRDNYAIYADLEHDVSDDLLVQYAFRYEDFSDFGGTANGKIASRYNVSDNFVIRGSVSTGFHAPTPGQANVSTIITTFDGVTGRQVDEGLVPPTHPDALASGGAPLKEEVSTNLSFGFTTDVIEDTNLAVDFYHIAVDDRIYRTGDITAPSGNKISFYTNALDVEHQGIDIVLTTSMAWQDAVNTKFTFAYNHNTIDVVGQSSINGITPVSDADVEDIENNYPKNRFVATALTEFGEQWQLMLRANFYGEHYDERGNINDAVQPSALVNSVVFFDLELNYDVNDDLSLTLGASNIFDEFVDEIGEANANRISVGLQYPRRTAANYEGGSWYLRAKYQF